MIPSKSIRAFCIDFNWAPDFSGPAAPGMFASADPDEHVAWYEEFGANVIQSFCVSFNGYAWYPSDIAPVTPGMAGGDFLGELIRRARPRGISVMGYFCLGQNPVRAALRPELYRHRDDSIPCLVFDEPYLDYFTSVIRESLRRTEVDGFMIDWIRPTTGRRKHWIDLDRQEYARLMGETLTTVSPPEAMEVEYDRRLLARAWRRIKEAVDDSREATVWINAPFESVDDPKWVGQPLLREADWILNESPDLSMLDWLSRETSPQTRIIQNLCGWVKHDANAWRKVDLNRYGLYGFAQADARTTFPYSAIRPQNQANVEIIRRAYGELKSSEARD